MKATTRTYSFFSGTLLTVMIVLAAAAPRLCADIIYNITINTTGLSTDNGDLAFDFTSGGGPSSNTITISGFTTDGTLGTTSNTGLVTGTLPGTVTLMDDPITSFFNEYLTGFTFGTSISFALDATTNGPGPSSSPDEFALYFLDSSAVNSLITTGDPTGANSLLLLDLDGSSAGSPSTFTVSSPAGVSGSMTPSGVSAVPEPSAVVLLLTVILLVAASLRGRLAQKRPH
jgi:hypothetical protein